MQPLAHGAFRFRHLADLREDGVLPVRVVRARAAARRRLQLLDALLHRDSFLVRESLELLADRGGALGGLLRCLLWAHRSILKPTCGALVKDTRIIITAHRQTPSLVLRPGLRLSKPMRTKERPH